jgi:uncharacterized heparinase superfamily protein
VPAGVTLRAPEIDLPRAGDLPEPLREAAERLRSEADEIMGHRVDYLGSGLVPLGEVIDWHRDFKSGYRWPAAFYQDVVVTRLDDESDAKVPWELSRGHQLLTLARAARLFGDERYTAELERQLRSWLAANPPGAGINWVNAMEVGLRAANWVWAIGTLDPASRLDADLEREVTASLQAHARHIASNLEGTPYLRSNHYLSDIFGLLVLAAALPDDPSARRWLRYARRSFEREILTQVNPDGLGFEASLAYHGLAFELFLLAKVVTDRLGAPLSPAYRDRLAEMHRASRIVRHPDGRLPQFGDADGGRVLPAGFGRPPTLDHLLWLGAAILDLDRPLDGPPHEEVAWTLGAETWRRLAARTLAEPPTRSAAFPDGGVYVLGGAKTTLVVRCGDVGQNGNGGHAHNDLLSFELSYGVPVVVDSGTYTYTADPAARNLFRGTAAHNTVVVDGAEINPLPERELFRLRQVAHATVERWEVTDERAVLVAAHDGYAPVVHRRTFELDRDSGAVTVDDELVGSGRHTARAFLHLVPGASVERPSASQLVVTLADAAISVELVGVHSVALSDGFVSSSFGVRDPAPIVIAEVEGALPLRFTIRIAPLR